MKKIFSSQKQSRIRIFEKLNFLNWKKKRMHSEVKEPKKENFRNRQEIKLSESFFVFRNLTKIGLISFVQMFLSTFLLLFWTFTFQWWCENSLKSETWVDQHGTVSNSKEKLESRNNSLFWKAKLFTKKKNFLGDCLKRETSTLPNSEKKNYLTESKTVKIHDSEWPKVVDTSFHFSKFYLLPIFFSLKYCSALKSH